MRAESSPFFLPLLTRRSCSSGDVKKVDGRSRRSPEGEERSEKIVTILGMAAEQSRLLALGDGWKKGPFFDVGRITGAKRLQVDQSMLSSHPLSFHVRI